MALETETVAWTQAGRLEWIGLAMIVLVAALLRRGRPGSAPEDRLEDDGAMSNGSPVVGAVKATTGKP